MKQKDIALIVVIVFVSAVISLLVSSRIFVTPKSRQQQVEVVQPISASFQAPDKAYFNSNSFDPAQLITIGQNTNTNPFSATSP